MSPTAFIPAARPFTDDTRPLFRRWRDARDSGARDALLERYTPLARKLARRYLGANEPFDDLLQVASVGLLLAIDRFDPDRGIAFSSFAVPTILGELRRYFRDSGWAVHVPRRAQERALAVEKARQELARRLGREPGFAQLAQALEWSIDDVLEAVEAAAGHHATSLDLPRGEEDGEGETLADRFGEIDPGFELAESRVSVASVMQHVPRAERRVLHLRFIDDMTQAQIGAEIGVSQMQVSRMLRDSLTRIAAMAERSTAG